MTQDTVVIDLDGTLSDGRARYHLVKGKHRDYKTFHARLGEDPCNEWCRKLICAFTTIGYRIVLVSARPHSAERATRIWLQGQVVPFHELHLLRQDGDSTPDQEIKRAWLLAYGKERVLFAVDDRQKVVDMWREEGLTCLQCAAWPDDKKAVKEPA